jgi:GNAT superfamily N-acetyltransferase
MRGLLRMEGDLAETLTVRIAGSPDLAAIDALLARTYPRLLKADYPPSVLVLSLPIISRANPALVASGTYYVVEEAGAVVGAGGWTRTVPAGRRGAASARTAQVRHVVTDHRRTRRGIGRALMTRILEDAATDGVTAIECLSTRTAVPFYAACGFAELGAVSVGLAPGIDFPAVRMARRLFRRVSDKPSS